jgi:hypothetical protein
MTPHQRKGAQSPNRAGGSDRGHPVRCKQRNVSVSYSPSSWGFDQPPRPAQPLPPPTPTATQLSAAHGYTCAGAGTQPRHDRLKPVESAEDLGDGGACKLLVLLTAAAGDADSPNGCPVERDAHTTFEADQLRVVEVVNARDHTAHPVPENS